MGRRAKRGRDVHGILLLDKPQGMTSNGCLQQVKRLFNAAKAGHTGSLDPLATGVLPLCFGEATKISQFLLDADKRYRVTAQLGQRTDTADSEGVVIAEAPVPALDADMVTGLLTRFTGALDQLPPMFSAVKHQGQPLYKLARAGKEVERKLRRIQIYSLTLVALEAQQLTLEVHCSKGTYVRTLVDDLGLALGCGAHVTALRRLQAGRFLETQCVTMERLVAIQTREGQEALDALLVPADAAVADLPDVVLPAITAQYIRQGQPVMARHLPTEGLVRLYDEDEFIGIGAILDDGRVAPRRLMLGS